MITPAAPGTVAAGTTDPSTAYSAWTATGSGLSKRASVSTIGRSPPTTSTTPSGPTSGRPSRSRYRTFVTLAGSTTSRSGPWTVVRLIRTARSGSPVGSSSARTSSSLTISTCSVVAEGAARSTTSRASAGLVALVAGPATVIRTSPAVPMARLARIMASPISRRRPGPARQGRARPAADPPARGRGQCRRGPCRRGHPPRTRPALRPEPARQAPARVRDPPSAPAPPARESRPQRPAQSGARRAATRPSH